MNCTGYLFDPSDVARLLRELPHLRDALGDPAREGKPSAAFPLGRKSERQLYRVLANDHYEHLAALLRSLDFCLGRGFTQPTLLRTRARSNFASAISELGTAEHFLLRGFDVQGLDVIKGSEPVPEFLARRDGLEVAVEVYHPIEWEGLGALETELIGELKNLDVPLDYGFEVCVEQLELFDEHGGLRHVHPAVLARQLDAATRVAIIDPMLGNVSAQLTAAAASVQVETEERDLNVRVSVTVTGAVASASNLPARRGTISSLGLTGYAPEAMFDRLVSGRVRRKAGKAQAGTAGSLTVLVVNLADSEVTTQLASPSYRAEFIQSLGRSFGASLPGYDLITVCELAGWGQELIVHWLLHNDRVPESSIRALFGDQLATSPRRRWESPMHGSDRIDR